MLGAGWKFSLSWGLNISPQHTSRSCRSEAGSPGGSWIWTDCLAQRICLRWPSVPDFEAAGALSPAPRKSKARKGLFFCHRGCTLFSWGLQPSFWSGGLLRDGLLIEKVWPSCWAAPSPPLSFSSVPELPCARGPIRFYFPFQLISFNFRGKKGQGAGGGLTAEFGVASEGKEAMVGSHSAKSVRRNNRGPRGNLAFSVGPSPAAG